VEAGVAECAALTGRVAAAETEAQTLTLAEQVRISPFFFFFLKDPFPWL
jgi:hypothetical protein